MKVQAKTPCLCLLPAVLLPLFGTTACQIGPGRLKAASSHYSDAVRVATSEQLLVNLVRLRYRDLPIFLDVSSISSQFEFAVDGGVGGQVGDSSVSGAGDLVNAGLGTRYSERPTITFSLLGGEAFQRRMLEPLDVVALAVIAESGWRADRILRLAVEEMNGLRNAPTASGPTPRTIPDFEPFLEAVELMESLAAARLVSFHFNSRREAISPVLAEERVGGDHVVAAVRAGAEFETTETGRGVALVVEKRNLEMRFGPLSRGSRDAARLRELLKLNPVRMRFALVALEDSTYDPFEPDRPMDEIALDTRSLVGVLYYLSQGVRVPHEDVEAGLVTSTVVEGGRPFDWNQLLDGLFRVESSESRPKQAAVAARHRGRWFYLEDSDEDSKSTFVLLNQLFSLQAGDVEEVKPVLTLPVGGN